MVSKKLKERQSRHASRAHRGGVRTSVPSASEPEIDAADLPYQIVLSQLEEVHETDAGQWQARCPAHADRTPSLALRETEERTLLMYCHAGCSTEEVLHRIGLKLSHLFPSGYALVFGKSSLELRQHMTMAQSWDVEQVDDDPVARRNLRNLAKEHRTSRHGLQPLADALGLSVEVLDQLQIGWDGDQFLFPERDHRGRLVGILLRQLDGSRRCVPGSRRGLTLLRHFTPVEGPIYVAEGATDTAALLGVGVNSVGRPAAKASRRVRSWLSELLSQYRGHPIVVLGDNDVPKNGVAVGKDGARALAQTLSEQGFQNVRWALPAAGYKDIREQITDGAWSKGLRSRKGGA